MSEETKTAVQILVDNLIKLGYLHSNEFGQSPKVTEVIEQAKEMQQEQAQLYATFILMCVNNNLPPITFNDWAGNIRR
jgi:hypothetical protein